MESLRTVWQTMLTRDSKTSSVPPRERSTDSSSVLVPRVPTAGAATVDLDDTITIPIIDGQLYVSVVRERMGTNGAHWFSAADVFDTLYFPFANDFGPPSLGQIYAFERALSHRRRMVRAPVHFYERRDPQKLTNALLLIGSYCVLRLGWSCEAVLSRVGAVLPLLAEYVDASPAPPTYTLPLAACLAALQHARALAWVDLDTFDYAEYTHYEQVENGDLNWIVPGRLLAFASPTHTFYDDGEVVRHTPAHYIKYFAARGVDAVVRLNKVEYAASEFEAAGISHYDMYFTDGTTPPWAIVERFLHVMDTHRCVAVHCKQGFGRTGTLNGCYLMRSHGFGPAEAIAFMRIMRPGSVVGPQQQFLHEVEGRLVPSRAAVAPTLKRKSPEPPALIPTKLAHKRFKPETHTAHTLSS